MYVRLGIFTSANYWYLILVSISGLTFFYIDTDFQVCIVNKIVFITISLISIFDISPDALSCPFNAISSFPSVPGSPSGRYPVYNPASTPDPRSPASFHPSRHRLPSIAWILCDTWSRIGTLSPTPVSVGALYPTALPERHKLFNVFTHT